ncbi:MAG: ABC transporter ATP-binding protein [Phycisphaeraceae bacterium]|nr:ABC transporter ATP-binding protein [Phycisphaeraceae bacterium]
MIRMEHVTKRFGPNAAVDDVCIDIARGDSVALWGSNGAGKTTLIRCALGLFAFGGKILVGGHDVLRDGKRARSLIGYVPQELGLYDDLRLSEAVRFFSRLKGLRTPELDAVLGGVGLTGHEHKRIRELSGGMKQRLALAIAMLGDPPVLILDEVTASLDACGRQEFVALLERLSGSGRTMLFASHRLEEVVALATRVVVLASGSVQRSQETGAFAASFGAGTIVHLMIPPAARERAMTGLRAEGFAPTLNGVGVLVPVHAERKAAPFRILAEAGVPVEDFELLRDDRAGLMPSQEKESGR